jgi:hypothetical protein
MKLVFCAPKFAKHALSNAISIQWIIAKAVPMFAEDVLKNAGP